eukprot:NODE_312_length_11237_cov_0.283624.p4 type:complete len:438 gc:universal NODE_312_length_11237_cov_0.283624:3515-2202(-)
MSLSFPRYKHFAIIGAGPSGFYAAQKFLQISSTKVDFFEKLPFPYGLVRYGVAPDNQDVKKCTHEFKSILRNGRVRFFGNVEAGKDFDIHDLKKYYNAVVLTTGAESANVLNLPGSQSIISSLDFTRWYNKHPQQYNRNFKIGKNVAIIGNGNVSLDIARMLLFPENLKTTDINEIALEALEIANVNKVVIFGRSSPLHTKFTALELRPFLKKPVNLFFDKSNLAYSSPWSSQFPRIVKRVYEIFTRIAELKNKPEIDKCLEFKFLLEPSSVKQTSDGLEITFQQNRFVSNKSGVKSIKISPTTKSTSFKFDTVISAIGSHAQIFPGITTFDSGELGTPLDKDKKIFATGWNRSNGRGVIANSMNDSHVLVNAIAHVPDSFKVPDEDRNKFTKSLNAVSKEKWLIGSDYEYSTGIKNEKLYKMANLQELLNISKPKL